jgi:predicted nucleotidyltransferase
MNSPNQFRLPPEVSATMSAYARLVDDKLPERIRGLYLAGSLALDDYRPGRSDIDFVAVSDTAFQPSELEMLQQVHAELRRTMPAGRGGQSWTAFT